MTKRILPTPEQLRQLLRYEPDTGKLFWRERPASMFAPGNKSPESNCKAWNSRYAGKEAFTSINGSGYKTGYVNSAPCISHRAAWAIVHGEWPADQIDHINGDKTDNRISNLREASNAENMCNKKARSDNKCGMKGVHWNKMNKKWKAQIYKAGEVIYLGLFDTPEAAHAAYCEAAKKYHGEFARTE